MSTATQINERSEVMDFTTSCAMHAVINRFHDLVKNQTPPGGIPIYSHSNLPPTLYLPGGHLFIAFEGIVFRVHQYFFDRDCFLWRDMNNRIKLGVDPTVGWDAFSPVIFPNITLTAKQFASMLWIIYNPVYGVYDTTREEWTQILFAALQLGFNNIIRLAKFKIEAIDQKEAALAKVEKGNRFGASI